jgi:hypothetical protein
MILRDKKVVGVFIAFSCAASHLFFAPTKKQFNTEFLEYTRKLLLQLKQGVTIVGEMSL